MSGRLSSQISHEKPEQAISSEALVGTGSPSSATMSDTGARWALCPQRWLTVTGGTLVCPQPFLCPDSLRCWQRPGSEAGVAAQGPQPLPYHFYHSLRAPGAWCGGGHRTSVYSPRVPSPSPMTGYREHSGSHYGRREQRFFPSGGS